jgi:hypothetical protein
MLLATDLNMRAQRTKKSGEMKKKKKTELPKRYSKNKK